MIELRQNSLVFSFPEVHPEAKLTIEFQRTFRIPDDGNDYPLPPGFGRFPLRHVDDYASTLPPEWIEHGGVMMPMYQSEALWISFNSATVRDSYRKKRRFSANSDEKETAKTVQGGKTNWGPASLVDYPCAIKLAAGKINAVSGRNWRDGLGRDPQNYVIAPEQMWLDGYCVERGVIRQFVAMPLGSGYSAEEQLTEAPKYGGIQIAAYPMRREAFERNFPEAEPPRRDEAQIRYCMSDTGMGLALGGRMRQEIYQDPYDITDWDTDQTSRCFVHILNSLTWRTVTVEDPPGVPLTADEYSNRGLPWFEYYAADLKALGGSSKLARLKSVIKMGKIKNDVPLPENNSVTPARRLRLRSDRRVIREGKL